MRFPNHPTSKLIAMLAIMFGGASIAVGQVNENDEIPENGAKLEARLISDVAQLTSAGRRSGEGYLDPTGKWIVFQSEREVGNPFYQIYLMNMEDGETKRVSPGKGKTTCAWIHPKTGDVMYSSTHDDPDVVKKQREEIELRETVKKRDYAWDYDTNFEIYRWEKESGKTIRLTNAKGYDAEGSYSPDGEWIAFASNRDVYQRELTRAEKIILDDGPEHFLDLYIMRADGSDVRRLTDAPGYDGGPFFSADGEKICWRKFNQAGTLAEIWTMNVDGTNKRQLTKMNAMSWAPYFHPSGKYLIYTTNRHGFKNFELYIIDAEGKSLPLRVTYTDKFDGLPVFTPDGERIVWTTERYREGASWFNSGPPKAQLAEGTWNHEAALKALGLSDKAKETTNGTEK